MNYNVYSMNNAYSMDCNSRYVFLSFDSIKTKTKSTSYDVHMFSSPMIQ